MVEKSLKIQEEIESKSRLFVFGSRECDQFETGDQRAVVRKPFQLQIFSTLPSIAKIVCGGLHTIALTVEG